MKKIRLYVSYDGTHYFGWQKTKEGLSIEGVLEKVLQTILQEEKNLEAASRTDRGVHAEEQIVTFSTEKELPDLKKFQKSVNSLLPKDIAIHKIDEVPIHFHPSLDVTMKEYHYHVFTGPTLHPFEEKFTFHFPYKVDLSLMQKEAEELIGTRDFSAFSNAKEKSQRREKIVTLYSIEIFPKFLPSIEGDFYLFILKGDRFLYRMARKIVGTLCYRGAKKLPIPMRDILKSTDRKIHTYTAPAKGLFLHKIYYKEFL